MVLTLDKLVNDDRFCGDVIQFLLYLPFGICVMALRAIMALILWIASIILPNKSAVRQMLSTFACWTFGVYVTIKGEKDPRCSVMVANYISCLDSLAVSHVLGTISLRKWKVPPFFASTLGIRNAAQFIRKQHFGDCPSKPVLVQPEGAPTNGKALLQFIDWPFQIGNRVQPIALTATRPFTQVTVGSGNSGFLWGDALWFLWTPATVFTVNLLPAVERHDDDDGVFIQRVRQAIAEALQIEMTEFTWEDLNRSVRIARPAVPPELMRSARQVKEVLPRVPLKDIMKDLARTRSVDVTITNFLEGVIPYTPEPVQQSPEPCAGPSQPKYVTPAPTGVFGKSARERQLSFQERKEMMIAEARKKYIEKHGLDMAMNC